MTATQVAATPTTADFDNLTAVIAAWQAGHDDALAELWPRVYHRLRQKARLYLGSNLEQATLEATELVHELFLKLPEAQTLQFESRLHFFHYAARLMRRILINHARRRLSLRKGKGLKQRTTELLQVDFGFEAPDPHLLSALDDALALLEELDPRRAKIVEMRFFLGMKHEEVAEVLCLSGRTVRREWQATKYWLAAKLGYGSKHVNQSQAGKR